MPSPPLSELAVTGRPERTRDVTRGARSLLRALGLSVLGEFPLPDGRRADLAALSKDGSLRIVEVKSSLEDLRADGKWGCYRAYCDRFYFAIPLELDQAAQGLFPADAGLIVADAQGAEILREAPVHPLVAASRRSMLVRFGQTAAERLHLASHSREVQP